MTTAEAASPVSPCPPAFAGFWRRFAAFLLDGLLLGLVANVLGYALFDTMVRIGPWGRALGFLIALAYFAPLESRLGGGQTPGKRLLKIRVVDATGAPLALARSTTRFAIFGVPYFLSGAALPAWVVGFAGGVPLALLSYGAFTALGTLLVFNRATHQSLHDLLTRSFIVRADPAFAPGVPARRLGRGHVAVTAAILVLAGALPLAAPRLLRVPLGADLRVLCERVAAQPEVRSATVFESTSTRYGVAGDGRLRALLVQAAIDSSLVDGDALATRLAGIALASWPGAARADRIVVVLSYGFDLGLASSWDSREFSYAPDQWRDRVAAGLGG